MLKYNHSESIPDIKYTYDIGGQFSLTNPIVRYNKPILFYNSNQSGSENPGFFLEHATSYHWYV